MVFLHLTRSGYKVQLDLLFSNMSWKSISADKATYRGCQHQSGWRHPGWSHWGWTCSSACYRSPWSTPAADKGCFFTCDSELSFIHHSTDLLEKQWEVFRPWPCGCCAGRDRGTPHLKGTSSCSRCGSSSSWLQRLSYLRWGNKREEMLLLCISIPDLSDEKEQEASHWGLESKIWNKVQEWSGYHSSVQAFFPASRLWMFWWGGETFSSYLAPFPFSVFWQSLCQLCCRHTCLSLFLPVHLSHHLSHSLQCRLLIVFSASCVNSPHLRADPQDPQYMNFKGFLFLSPPICLRGGKKPTGAIFSWQTSFCNVLEQYEL